MQLTRLKICVLNKLFAQGYVTERQITDLKLPDYPGTSQYQYCGN